MKRPNSTRSGTTGCVDDSSPSHGVLGSFLDIHCLSRQKAEPIHYPGLLTASKTYKLTQRDLKSDHNFAEWALKADFRAGVFHLTIEAISIGGR